MSSTLNRIQASHIDGRARTPRFIQGQLQSLHSGLLKSATELRLAIAASSPHTPAEVAIEYYLALSALKEQYASVDFEQILKEEYSIANEENAPERRVATGIAYIVPATHTLFYSVVAPLAAAIAAGNCVVLELGPTLSEINSLLRKILPHTLDSDTFAIVDSPPESTEFLSSCIQVLPTTLQSQIPTVSQLVSPSTSRTIAVVDRTSDLKSAASALVTARFSFGGTSPYAPDLVLVNEFVLDEFSNAVVEQAAKAFSKNVSASKTRRKGLGEEEAGEEGTSVIVSGASGSIVSVKKRDSKLLKKKLTEPILLLHSISSLDDAIDFANKSGTPLLASYIFAAPPAAKYISQFVDAYLSLINQIPIELLVGSAAPLSHAPSVSASNRFTKTMFSVPRPQYIQPPSTSSPPLTTILSSSFTTELDKLAGTELPPTGQKPGNHIGFFEQGIITGLATILLPAVVGTVALGFYGVRGAVRHFRG